MFLEACAQVCHCLRWATEHLWLSLQMPNTLCNSKVPWSCRDVFLFILLHNWRSVNCAFKMLVEGRIMPVKTAGVFSIRGATLSHKQLPYCSLCWHQRPNQHNNKACIFDETFRSQTKKISLHSRRELNYFGWLHTYSTEKKHTEKVGVCQMKLHISLLPSYLFMSLYWKLALKMHLVSKIRWNISCLTEVLLRRDCQTLVKS